MPSPTRTATTPVFQLVLIALILIAVSLTLYAPSRDYGFVDYDDPDYVSENRVVQQGLTTAGLLWAVSSGHASNWHPLTWFSLMLDCQLFGTRPGPMHLHNAALHAASGFLLFWLLRRLTGATWRSAAAAAIFAWHPLRVESVAWISERKDVLSTFYWLLTMCAWVRFVEQRTATRYALSLLSFALGLMAKPMLVALPVALFVLDYWPLRRLSWLPSHGASSQPNSMNPKANPKPNPKPWITAKRLILEKLPFFALAVAVGMVTLYVQRRGGSMTFGDTVPVTQRLLNAVVAYVEYLRKFCWPSDLAVYYPHPGHWPLWRVTSAASVLAFISALAVWQRERRPYLLAGWLWYLVTLLPALGLVQVGGQAWADRYTYVPMIGIVIMAVWGSADLVQRWHWPKPVTISLAAAMLLACIVTTRHQLPHWQNTLTLFTHALAVTENNDRAHKEVADVYEAQKQFALAQSHYEDAVRLNPRFFHAHMNYAISLYQKAKYKEAAQHFLNAVQINPNSAEAHSNLGAALDAVGDSDGAITHYREALRLRPEYAAAQRNLSRALADAAAKGKATAPVGVQN